MHLCNYVRKVLYDVISIRFLSNDSIYISIGCHERSYCKIQIAYYYRKMLMSRQVLSKMLYDSGKTEDVNYQIYNTWFATFITDFTIKKIIYVKTDPKVAHERTQV